MFSASFSPVWTHLDKPMSDYKTVKNSPDCLGQEYPEIFLRGVAMRGGRSFHAENLQYRFRAKIKFNKLSASRFALISRRDASKF
jgi:hypothetical protein